MTRSRPDPPKPAGAGPAATTHVASKLLETFATGSTGRAQAYFAGAQLTGKHVEAFAGDVWPRFGPVRAGGLIHLNLTSGGNQTLAIVHPDFLQALVLACTAALTAAAQGESDERPRGGESEA